MFWGSGSEFRACLTCKQGVGPHLNFRRESIEASFRATLSGVYCKMWNAGALFVSSTEFGSRLGL